MLKGVVSVCCVEEIINLQFMCFEGRQKLLAQTIALSAFFT